MPEDEVSGPKLQSFPEDPPGLDSRAVKGSPEEDSITDQSIPNVEVESAYDLLILGSVPGSDVGSDPVGPTHELTVRHRFSGRALRQLDVCQESRGSGAAHAEGSKGRPVGAPQAHEPSGSFQQAFGCRRCSRRTEQHRQELHVRQCTRPTAEQSFPRTHHSQAF